MGSPAGGATANRKLTEPGDLAPMRAVLAERVAALGASDPSPGGRIGIGFDGPRMAGPRHTAAVADDP